MDTDWIIQPPNIIRRLFTKSLWRIDTAEREIFLTFDDGPVPEQTPWVLDTLDSYGAQATFFCVGDNVHKNHDIYEETIRRGHITGCHTMNHVQLFRQSWKDYSDNIDCGVSQMDVAKVCLFRPPHGQMSPWRARQLTRDRFDRIVFWDVMPKDYDRRLSNKEVLQNVLTHVRQGSIIVLHDSIKADERMRYALQGTIETLGEQGYKFCSLTPNKYQQTK